MNKSTSTNSTNSASRRESRAVRPLDLTGSIIALESGEMTDPAEIRELFELLVSSGTIWHLQGSYQRAARDLGLI